MTIKRSGVGRLRVRLTSSKSEGPDPDYTRRAAKLLPGGQNGVSPTITSSFDENASDVDSITRQLSEDILRCAAGRESILIDVAFDLDGNARAELVIGVALGAVVESLAELSAVVVLFEEMPTERQEIPRRVAAHPSLSARTLICSLSSKEKSIRPSSADWDIDAFLGQVHYRLENYLELAKGKVVRRRGVFQSPFDGRCFGYWYSAANAEDELRQLFSAYFSEANVQDVIYDDQAEEWLVSLLREVCSTHLTLSPSEVLLDIQAADQFANRKVAVVGPMLRTGTVFRGIHSSLEKLTSTIKFLAIMADENSVDSFSRFHHTKRFAINDASLVDIDYFVPVTHDIILDNDWRFEMAATAEPTEVQNPSDDWAAPTATAMWSLIEGLPIGIEDPTPLHRRTPISAFPQLKEMEDRDAIWLAESFLRIAQDEHGVQRSLVVIVLPQEETEATDKARNGSRPLSDAFKRSLRVVTQVVSRDEIETSETPPDYLTKLIEDHPGYDIVVIDESAVSYHSLERLGAMVTKATKGRPPRFAGAVIEAVTDMYQPPADFRSLLQWQPLVRPATGRHQ